MGGHSKSIKDLLHSLSDNYKQILFLTQISTSITHAPKLFNEIKKYSKIYGIDSNLLFLRKKCKNFCQEIVHNHIKVLLVYIHPDDVFGAAVLAYLKNTTDIKIIYVNHASHYPVLGMSFADVILEGTRTTEEITQRKRHFKNTKIIGLQSLHKNETVYYSTEVLKELRESLGIQPHNVISMSGGSAYKFFDGDKSAYLQMIKRLLIKDSNLVHIIITQLNQIQKRILENIFIDTPHIRRRLIILPFQANFDKWFQIADLFIDSFPISSALTQVDLMRNKVPPVVKINIERPEFSFHEYQSENYPYMFQIILLT